ncbi:type I restriction endonuclease subunit R [Methylotuvimicrobium buryatense]|uniref:Type I restriction enzyme endonuclease subunit n=1 Tax=Methylotuvimicrobium buryatense TaxID=95641 RepID=A0A4P9USR5_METBY|nr:type I restriction endonuclease subunit R [Methylotuvimicrobium buryatense]QCW84589.1 type I restriction endonuclease subunit R [Methylotuvimicrobium buryatense]
MSYEYSEDGLIETATQEVLEDLGWTVVTAWQKESLATQADRSDGLLGRLNKSEVILERYLLQALRTSNPDVPEAAYQQAVNVLKESAADKHPAAINKDKHDLLVKGVPISYQDEKGVLQKKRLKVFDFDVPANNHFLAVRQFEVVGKLYNRRPDVVGFVNGIPLVFFELKAHHTDLRHAFDNNLSDYKDTIPEILHCNAFIILSNGADSRVGTLTSPYKFFMEWKRIEEEDEGVVSLDTLLRGTCAPHRLLDLFENFLLFDGEGSEVTKIMAKNHQFIGVNKVIDRSAHIEALKGKLGVFWHTQGSGKSYSMVFLCQKILRKLGGSYTFLLVVDRTELENQLYDTFSSVGAVTEDNVRAKSRDHLRELLTENHRYVFTLIHKFSIDPKKETDYPLITDRPNIIVISDEAHRTQGGAFAGNMRFKGIPNASYLGFTGTPIIKNELELTRNIFGEYVSVYDFKRAIVDGATLPLRYLNRGEKLGIENPDLDERMSDIIDDAELNDDQRRKLEREFKRDYPILTSERRLDAIARDLVWHFNDRGYQGKAMFVALDKPTAVRMHDLVMKYWPEYVAELKQRIHDADDQQEELKLKHHLKRVEATEVCVVVSPEQNEVRKFAKLGLDIEPHRKKMVERDLETEFKDDDNPFRLVIVCAMWITGFDVPSVSTVYLDKPIKGHTLMQTITRANRVYDDEKENGLIVDYGNVYKQLEKAYSIYGEGGDRGKRKNGDEENDSGRPLEMLVAMADELADAILTVRQFLQNVAFDLDKLLLAGTALERLSQLKQATNAVCLNATMRTRFEVAARDVFRKYKALYPEPEVKPFIQAFNAIEAIYEQLNQKTKLADISDVIRRLQQEVDISVNVRDNEIRDNDFVDLSCLDFDKLRAAFAKSKQKNAVVFDLQAAIQKKLEQMVQQNPLRLEFYEKYKAIIAEYNQGKDIQAVQKAFDDLNDFMQNGLMPETERAMREGLDEETLAIFDLLKKPELTKAEDQKVKEVAKTTLATLKAEKLKIERWRESTQVAAQVKTLIDHSLQWLPQETYPDEEVDMKSLLVYQHIYANYQGAGESRYGHF